MKILYNNNLYENVFDLKDIYTILGIKFEYKIYKN